MGGATTIWVIVEKLVKQSKGMYVRGITDQPLFYIAILAIILGAMLFLAGFLGDLISRNSSDRNKYLIDETIDNKEKK